MTFHSKKSTWLAAGWVVSACCLVGCLPAGGISIGDDEMLEGYGLRIDETRIQASLETGAAYVDFPIEVIDPSQGMVPVDVEVAIRDLHGELYGLARVHDELEEESNIVQLEVPGLPDALFSDTLGDYNLEFRVETTGGDLYGRRSMFSVVRRVSAVVVGSDVLVAGGQGSLRVTVSDASGDAPIPDARIEVDYVSDEGSSNELYSGSTDAFGVSKVWFPVLPAYEGTGQLAVRVYHEEGSSESRHPIQIKRQSRILLTTDKPLYQPSQTMHLRALVMDDARRTPAAHQEVLFEVRDGKGNKVMRKEIDTNEYGVASTTFRLARMVNMGRYTIAAAVGGTVQEKTVTVDRYALPKFKVELAMDRGYYMAGQTAHGTLRADYTFGQPVARADVSVTLYQYVGEWDEYAILSGETGDDGAYQFDLDLPPYAVGLPLEQGGSLMKMDVLVTDGAGSSRLVESSITIAQSNVIIQVIPERYMLAPSIENIVWIVATNPAGAPVAADLEINVNGSEIVEVSTSEMGLGTLHFVPIEGTNSLSISGEDETGSTFTQYVNLSTDGTGGEVVLLRTDAALYRVGDSIHASVTAPRASDRVYLDVVRGGQTVLEDILEVVDHGAEAIIDLGNDMSGTLVLSVYYISDDGNIVRDQRVVYVEPATGLRLSLETDRDVYRPAGTAVLDIRVVNVQGEPVQAAVGINVVDEAVFALTELKPGMEQTYFNLEDEIREPTVTVYGWSVQDLFTGGSVDTGDPDAQDTAAMLFAAASGGDVFGIYYSSRLNVLTAVLSVTGSRVDEDLEAIVEALERYLAATADSFLGSPTAASWVSAHKDSWYDPWGQPYEAIFSGSSLTLRSSGVDELWGTEDDLESGGYVDLNAGRDLPGGFTGTEDDGEWDPSNVADAAADASSPPDDHGEEGEEGVHVRSYFPETLLVEPSLITDEAGHATLEIPLADSITTWRVSGMANSTAGELGSNTEGILVFQPFFIDVNFPATLTLGDTITVPVAVYNYTESVQDVTVSVTEDEWFTLGTPAVQTVSVEAMSVTSVPCTITSDAVGWHMLEAWGSSGGEADAVRRSIEVLPSGQETTQSRSDMIEGSSTGSEVVVELHIPAGAVDDASELLVKVYPGMFSQAVEGLDSILRMPSGCFEQTSSATYPNVMVLDYLQVSGQSTPEVELKAREYINLGYQRLLTYEVSGGGFSWFGQAPAHNVLTAYGLMEISDMARVHPVDEAVITRTAAWLAAGQSSDGSWTPTDGGIAEGAIDNYENNVLRTTGYILWSLLESEYDGSSVISSAVRYIESHRSDAADPYTMAILSLALLGDNPDSSAAQGLLDDLAEAAVIEENGAHWEGGDDPGLTYSSGDAHSIETTALTALAFMRAGAHIDLAQQALNWLVRNKDSFGNWHTTQATIYSIRAMITAIAGSGAPATGTIDVLHNGTIVEILTLTPEDYDVFRQVDLKEYYVEGTNTVRVVFTGDGTLMYQVSAIHYLPWAGSTDPGDGPIGVEVDYDSTDLYTDDVVTVTVDMVNRTDANLMMVMLDLGLPPGFSVLTGDLDAHVSAGLFSRYEMTGRQIIVYFEYIAPGHTTFSYRMRANNPIEAEAPASRVYLYYDPRVESFSAPIAVRVD
ncbi:MAG: hypothetical protein JRG91_07915 [Deltaproteobacteria bacterium]|nr:hypothetical protein [Deltaproteobacteria bacterium]